MVVVVIILMTIIRADDDAGGDDDYYDNWDDDDDDDDNDGVVVGDDDDDDDDDDNESDEDADDDACDEEENRLATKSVALGDIKRTRTSIFNRLILCLFLFLLWNRPQWSYRIPHLQLELITVREVYRPLQVAKGHLGLMCMPFKI